MPLDPAATSRAIWVLSAALVAITGPARTHAQEQGWEVLLPVEASSVSDTSAAGAWAERIELAYADAPQSVATLRRFAQGLALATQTLERADVERLADVEQHLLRARTHAAALAESDALGELSQAEQQIQAVLHVPGAAMFYAEVETWIGLVSAQAGMDALAIAALRRAAVVDPRRGVRAAEATPTWVDRASAIAREIAAGPQGEIAITTNVAGARVFVDDALQGVAPLTFRTTRGVHVLRVEATGYRSLGMLLPVDAGARPAVQLELSRDRVLLGLDSLAHAGRSRDAQATRDVLRQLQRAGAPIRAAWGLETSATHPERALLTRCEVEHCEAARRLELDGADLRGQRFGQALDPAGLGRDREARDHVWLHVADNLPERDRIAAAPTPWWQRWYVWTAAAALVGGATVLGIAASDGPDSRGLRVTVEP